MPEDPILRVVELQRGNGFLPRLILGENGTRQELIVSKDCILKPGTEIPVKVHNRKVNAFVHTAETAICKACKEGCFYSPFSD